MMVTEASPYGEGIEQEFLPRRHGEHRFSRRIMFRP